MELQFLFWDVVSVFEETLDGSMKVSFALVIGSCLLSPDIARIWPSNQYLPSKLP